MSETQKKIVWGSMISSLLLLTFYERVSREAYLALALSSVFLIFAGGLTYFLRIGLGAAWIRILMALFACAAAQAAWSKLGLEPWWALSALSLYLPTVSEIRQPQKGFEFAVKVVIFEAAAGCFFFVRAGLELTESHFFWQQPAGHLILLGLIVLAFSVSETRSVHHGT